MSYIKHLATVLLALLMCGSVNAQSHDVAADPISSADSTEHFEATAFFANGSNRIILNGYEIKKEVVSSSIYGMIGGAIGGSASGYAYGYIVGGEEFAAKSALSGAISGAAMGGAFGVAEGYASRSRNIVFGNNENQQYHTFRHVDELELNREDVINAIE